MTGRRRIDRGWRRRHPVHGTNNGFGCELRLSCRASVFAHELGSQFWLRGMCVMVGPTPSNNFPPATAARCIAARRPWHLAFGAITITIGTLMFPIAKWCGQLADDVSLKGRALDLQSYQTLSRMMRMSAPSWVTERKVPRHRSAMEGDPGPAKRGRPSSPPSRAGAM